MWSVYLTFNVVLCVATIVLLLAARVFRNVRSLTLLSWHYWGLLFVAAAFAFQSWLPIHCIGESVLQSWIPHDPFSIDSPHRGDVSYSSTRIGSFTGATAQQLLVWIGISLGAWIAAHYTMDAYKVHRIRRCAQLVRRIGRVCIWVAEEPSTPFSYWAWGKAHVVLPTLLVAKPHLYKLAIAHELQHHRQKDTVWLYAAAALRILCSLNPAAHLWSSRVSRLQEFACDEQMLLRRQWSISSYSNGLLETAMAVKHSRQFACTNSLLGINDSPTLKRRIQSMLQSRTAAPSIILRRSLGGCFLLSLGAVASIANAWVGEHRADDAASNSDATTTSAPVPEGTLVAAFEPAVDSYARTRKHDGIDIAAPTGTLVNAHRDGIVLEVRERKGCGLSVRVRHDANMQSLYCNLAELRVRVGDRVTHGQPLAELADLGPNMQSHLHLEIEIGGHKVDPAEWVSVSESR